MHECIDALTEANSQNSSPWHNSGSQGKWGRRVGIIGAASAAGALILLSRRDAFFESVNALVESAPPFQALTRPQLSPLGAQANRGGTSTCYAMRTTCRWAKPHTLASVESKCCRLLSDDAHPRTDSRHLSRTTCRQGRGALAVASGGLGSSGRIRRLGGAPRRAPAVIPSACGGAEPNDVVAGF